MKCPTCGAHEQHQSDGAQHPMNTQQTDPGNWDTPPFWIGRNMIGCDYHAGNLLADMRPAVEEFLVEAKKRWPLEISSAASQTLRATQTLTKIDERIEEKGPMWICAYDDWCIKAQKRLEHFLHVAATVRILERRARDPEGLDVFGLEK